MEIIDTSAGDVTRNCKNYLTDGGDRLVIGGTLEVLDTATVTGLQSGYATEQTAGSVYQATNQAESAATTIADLERFQRASSKAQECRNHGGRPAGFNVRWQRC